MANNFLGGLFGDRDNGSVDFILIICLFCCLCGGDGFGRDGGSDLLLPILLLLCVCGGGCFGRRRDGDSIGGLNTGCNTPVL